MEICASLNHHKKTKADGSRLIPRKHTETLVLLSVYKFIFNFLDGRKAAISLFQVELDRPWSYLWLHSLWTRRLDL